MAKIQVLDKHTAELIAAGEVVERPSSVIKELVENCLDAGATAVTVEIKNGGVTLMSVSDNGEGMAREDVPIAFLRHATSKVRTADDLEAIGTLGFRGEALASIAAVSRVELTTRREEDLAGTHYQIEGGEPGELDDLGCPKGTTIVVRDLFYNVPARMKFLKKDVSEGNAVAAVIDRLALSHPAVRFRFIRDGREELNTAGDGDLHACIYSVLGRDFAKSLLPVSYSFDGVTVKGFVNAPSSPRANRTMQHFFVNSRYVKTRTAMAALEQAFKGSIMGGKFPACVLFIELAPELVDANVHPAKVEIRFVNEKPVFQAVFHAVKTALEGQTRIKATGTAPAKEMPPIAQMRWEEQPPATPVVSNLPKSPVRTSAPDIFVDEPEAGPVLTIRDASAQWGDLPREDWTASLPRTTTPKEPTKASNPPVQPTAAPTKAPETTVAVVEQKTAALSVRYIGEFFKTYLLAEMNDELYIIDKHAAHERMIYNQLKESSHADTQQLLSPVPVTLGREEYAALLAELSVLTEAGFDVEDFGGSEVLVRGIPMMLSGCDIAATLQEIAGGFLDGGQTLKVSKLEWIYASTACRAAVKAGNINSSYELAKFAERVLRNNDIRTCPHGRPVCFAMTRQEIEKRFGRIV
ncbi:MAG: DNA mismatch repair endonuclease MutL [Clostridia bacterium]|nr:DNA mismatch repair endonuclease MutL [Clostridia bacterium]